MVSTPAKRSVTFARANAVPLYRQIYQHFREAITVGQLRPGNRLPSVRRLAEEFGTARGTIDAAYAMLAGEGYILSRGPAGTIVSPQLGGPKIGRGAAKRLGERAEQRAISAP